MLAFGRQYPFKYDRRHDIGIALTYKFSDKFDFGGTWVFGSGYPVTLAQEQFPSVFVSPESSEYSEPYYYYYDDTNIDNIEHRNNYRLPNYHRLDVGINRHIRKDWGKLTFNVAVYNAYFHMNPLFVTKGYDRRGNKKFFEVGIFPIIPSFSVIVEL